MLHLCDLEDETALEIVENRLCRGVSNLVLAYMDDKWRFERRWKEFLGKQIKEDLSIAEWLSANNSVTTLPRRFMLRKSAWEARDKAHKRQQEVDKMAHIQDLMADGYTVGYRFLYKFATGNKGYHNTLNQQGFTFENVKPFHCANMTALRRHIENYPATSLEIIIWGKNVVRNKESYLKEIDIRVLFNKIHEMESLINLNKKTCKRYNHVIRQ